MRFSCQNGIEKSTSDYVAIREIGIEIDLLGQAGIAVLPVAWGRGKMRRRRCALVSECRHDRIHQASPYNWAELANQHNVDEILDARVFTVIAEVSRIRVKFFREMLFQRNEGNSERFNTGEDEEFLGPKSLSFERDRLTDLHIDVDIFKSSAVEAGADVKTCRIARLFSGGSDLYANLKVKVVT